jgi:hypothetical protein
MPYCPNCSLPVESNANNCSNCGARFGHESAWKPTEQPVISNNHSGPEGIGGWLVLPLLGLIVTPIRMVYQFLTDLWPVLNASTWNALTVSGSPAYHPLWEPLIIFEVVANIVVFAFGLWVLMAFFGKYRQTPKLFIIWIASHAAMQLVDVILGSQIPAVAAETDQQSIMDLARALVGAAIWIPYFLRSKRVANTFVS